MSTQNIGFFVACAEDGAIDALQSYYTIKHVTGRLHTIQAVQIYFCPDRSGLISKPRISANEFLTGMGFWNDKAEWTQLLVRTDSIVS